MSDTRSPTANHARPTQEVPAPTGWVGWVIFGGVMLVLNGCFAVINGLVALFDDQFYLVKSDKLIVHMDFTAWGWTHLILGAIAVLAGLGILAGQTWARVFGAAVAFLSAIANLVYISAYPVWGVIAIAVDVLVIFALVVHGREVR